MLSSILFLGSEFRAILIKYVTSWNIVQVVEEFWEFAMWFEATV